MGRGLERVGMVSRRIFRGLTVLHAFRDGLLLQPSQDHTGSCQAKVRSWQGLITEIESIFLEFFHPAM